MPRNGSGTYTLPQPAFVAGTTISSSAMNSDLSDIANALTGSLPRDGQAGMTGVLKIPDGSASAPALTFNNDDALGFIRSTADRLGVVVAGTLIGYFGTAGWVGPTSTGTPIGSLLDYAGAAAPTGWILCYGQNVSRTTYALLFAAIGTTFGSGDGATTFGLPDLRGRLIYGRDDMGGVAASRLTLAYFGSAATSVGNVGGSQSQALLTGNLPAYTPSGSAVFTGNAMVNVLDTLSGTSTGGGAFSINTVASQSNVTPTGSVALTMNAQGGTSTAFAIASPGMVMNKIIYAGA